MKIDKMGAANFTDFISENAKRLREYADTWIEIRKLELTRIVSVAAGSFIWTLASFILMGMILFFGGITLGFWLSQVTNSYITGFGIITASFLLLFIIITKFKRKFFIDPVAKRVLHQLNIDDKKPD